MEFFVNNEQVNWCARQWTQLPVSLFVCPSVRLNCFLQLKSIIQTPYVCKQVGRSFELDFFTAFAYIFVHTL